MKLFRKKRSSRGFDKLRRSNASNGEERISLLGSTAFEKTPQISYETLLSSSSSLTSRSMQDGEGATAHVAQDSSLENEEHDSQPVPALQFDATLLTKNTQVKNEGLKSLESADAAHECAITEEGKIEELPLGSPTVVSDASVGKVREDPPGDQKHQYVQQDDSTAIKYTITTEQHHDHASHEVSKDTAPTPRKPQKKSKIMHFLRNGNPRHKKTPTKAAKPDPLNTTIETSPSADSNDPAILPTETTLERPVVAVQFRITESRDATSAAREVGDGATQEKAPVRKGPVEIANVNLSTLIKSKNAMKKRPEPSVLKPLKADRSRPPTMSMSNRNEEQFQRYIQRQNRGRKVRESTLVPTFN